MVFTIADILNQWQAVGVFNILLPWLLFFAVVFGILNTTKILGGHKGVQVIIAAVLGALAIQYNYFSDFLNVMAPNLGIGVAVILAIMIIVGLFIPSDERRYWLWGLGAISFIVAIIVISNAFDALGYNSYLYSDYVGYIVGAVLLLGLVIAVGASGGDDKRDKGKSEVAIVKPWDEK